MAFDPLFVSELRASEQTLAFQRDSLVFDCLSLFYVLDEPYTERCLAGGVDAANVTFSSETEDWDAFLRKTEIGLDKIQKSPSLALATCSEDVLAAKRAGKLAVIPGTQGSAMVGRDIYRVEIMHRLGFRFFGPAYTGATVFCDGCGEIRNAGLSFLGKELIECLNGLTMLVDLSHVGHQSRYEIAQLANHPVCTHSNAYAVHANDRNTKDETAKLVADKGGVMGVCALTHSVAGTAPSIEHLLDHAEHYIETIGIDHVGVGFDFVEAYRERFFSGEAKHEPPKWRTLRPDIFGTVEDFFDETYPIGIESIRLFPNFTQGLFDRGYTEEQVAAVIGGNWFRNFKEVVG